MALSWGSEPSVRNRGVRDSGIDLYQVPVGGNTARPGKGKRGAEKEDIIRYLLEVHVGTNREGSLVSWNRKGGTKAKGCG